MCIWTDVLTGCENAEWMDEDEADLSGVDEKYKLVEKLNVEAKVVIKKLEDWIKSSWEPVNI